MKSWKKALGLGFLSWLLPFAVSFAVFPLKHAVPALFDTVMDITVLASAVLLTRAYFRHTPVAASEALYVGGLWLACNLVLDYPMFAYAPWP